MQKIIMTKLKLIAGPDVNGTYVLEDSKGEYRLFTVSGSDSLTSVEEILENGEWVSQWRGSQW